MPESVHVDELEGFVGRELGVSDWLQIDQQRVDDFSAVTRDDQWIHTDPTRAADGPFGATVAHGLLTLSLIPSFTAEVFQLDGARSRINYGYDRVRFPRPVLVGDRVRDRVVVDAVAFVATGIRLTTTHTIEIDGQGRPAAVVTALLQVETLAQIKEAAI